MAANSSRYSSHRSSMVCRASAAMIGATRIVCAITMACGREQQAPRPERPRARQTQIYRQPDDDRRQAHQRIEHHDGCLAGPENRVSASKAPSGTPTSAARNTALQG